MNKNVPSKMPLEIMIINRSGNPLPGYETAGSSGMDLRANLAESLSIKPLERVLVSTGIYMEIPPGYEGQVRPRSGLAIKQGITCLNTPGTIDSDYRGEIKIILINLSDCEQVINPGDRIAQIIFMPVEQARLKEVNILEETDRSSGGFGHTGKH